MTTSTMTFLCMRSIQNAIVSGLEKLVKQGESMESLEQYKDETLTIWEHDKNMKEWIENLNVSEYLNK